MKTKNNTDGHQMSRSSTEAQLVFAAKKIFSEYGYSAATTRKIAQTADVNLGLITRYFKNKYGLLEAVIEHDLKNRLVSSLPYPPQKDLKAECLAYTKFNFERQVSQLEYLRIVVSQLLTDRKFVKKFRDKSLIGPHPDFRKRIVQHFKKLRTFEIKEIENFVIRVETSTLHTVLFYVVIGGIPHADALAENLAVVQGLINALKL